MTIQINKETGVSAIYTQRGVYKFCVKWQSQDGCMATEMFRDRAGAEEFIANAPYATQEDALKASEAAAFGCEVRHQKFLEAHNIK